MSSNFTSTSTSPFRRRRRPAEPPPTWSRAQRRLHWTIAALVIAGAGVGLYMVALPFEQLLLKFLLYQLHKTIGITVFALAVAQLVLHRRRGRPAWDAEMPTWQPRAARATHLALFALLLVTPVLGYLTAATAPAHIPTLFLGVLPIPHIVGVNRFWFDILRRVHLALAILILALAAVHASAAINHHRQGRRVLARMWRG